MTEREEVKTMRKGWERRDKNDDKRPREKR